MQNNQSQRAVHLFGFAFIGLAALQVAMLVHPLFLDSESSVHVTKWTHPGNVVGAFGGSTALLLFTGVGVLLRKRWGYYLLKALLYVILLGFPIGTLVSWLALRYIRNQQLREQFQ